MSLTLRVWIRRGLFVSLPLLALFLVWRSGTDSPKLPPTPPLQKPPSVIRGVRLMNEEADGTRWTIRASAGTGLESEGTGRLRDVSALFERGGKQVEVRAPLGEIRKGNTLTVSGGVKVLWGEFEASAESATYDRGRGMVTSADTVGLAGRRLKVEGRGLEVDVEGKTIRVLSNVRATVGGRKQ